MSNTLAISAVTAGIGHLLRRVNDPAVAPIPTAADITLGPPDLSTGARQRLNLFLYEVVPNAALRNAELPVRDGSGVLTRQPVLALNLHYLLTAFGQSNNELEAHHLLAQAMSVLHDNGAMPRKHVRAALTAFAASYAKLTQSDLPDQPELVKLTPLALTQEEVAKIWSAFPTMNYRLSVAYEATVVLVERRRPARATAPVRRARVVAVPLRRPHVDTIAPQIAVAGQQLTVGGRELASDGVRVRFPVGDPVAPSAVSDHELKVVPPAALRAGAHPVQVLHPVQLGDPPTEHRAFESNTAVFVLAPRITTSLPRTPLRSVARGSTLTLDVSPPVLGSQRAELLLGPLAIPRNPPADIPETPTLAFRIPAATDVPTIEPGDHLVQVRVAGAESALELETTPGPQLNTYVAPRLRVT